MPGWTTEELDRIGDATEMQLAPLRRDGGLGSAVTVWVVREGDDLYVRSHKGTAGRWYQGTRAHHAGHIRAGGLEKDVRFVDAGTEIGDRIDAAYRSKYRDEPAQFVDPMVRPAARETTMQLVPR